MSKIWLVKMPACIYEQNVKSLAFANSLTVIDERYRAAYEKGDLAENPPELTLKAATKPKTATKPKAK